MSMLKYKEPIKKKKLKIWSFYCILLFKFLFLLFLIKIKSLDPFRVSGTKESTTPNFALVSLIIFLISGDWTKQKYWVFLFKRSQWKLPHQHSWRRRIQYMYEKQSGAVFFSSSELRFPSWRRNSTCSKKRCFFFFSFLFSAPFPIIGIKMWMIFYRTLDTTWNTNHGVARQCSWSSRIAKIHAN